MFDFIFSKKGKTYLVLFIIFSIFFSQETKAETSGIDRYGLYIGANNGGSNYEKLLYAESDAEKLMNTMQEIGGISEDKSFLLLSPDKNTVDETLEKISSNIEQNKDLSKRSEFFFYYSGHSDENSLKLGKTSYDYSDLKEAVSKVPSDVHVVILDSCYSGNFIRRKGGLKKKPFLVDDSTVVKGHAYLSSSSSKEFSQESDEIEASFFTNAMITGLRGAADTTGDNKVSLNELYSYAFNETLAKTEGSSAGPQHPNYNITLVGSGDLILSDVSTSDSALSFAKEIEGKVIVRNSDGKLISEINKTSSSPILLALPQGDYSVSIAFNQNVKAGKVHIGKNSIYEVKLEALDDIELTENHLRGAEIESESESSGVTFKPFDFQLIAVPYDKEIWSLFSLGLVGTSIYNTNVLQVSPLFCRSEVASGVQGSGVFNVAGTLNGAQGTGVFNKASHLNGAQFAGVFNVSSVVNGFQGAGVFNTADCIRGIQAAGVFNFAKKVDGIQAAGVINVAKKARGLQIGVINYAEENTGFVIGLFNYVRNGVHDFGVFYDSNKLIGMQFQSGTNAFFTTFGYEAEGEYFFREPDLDKDSYFNVFAGFGTRLGKSALRLDLELLCFFQDNSAVEALKHKIDDTAKNVSKNSDGNPDFTDDELDTISGSALEIRRYIIPAFRMTGNLYLGTHMSLFAGAMLRLEVNSWNKVAFSRGENNLALRFKNEDKSFCLYPSFEIGVKIR